VAASSGVSRLSPVVFVGILAIAAVTELSRRGYSRSLAQRRYLPTPPRDAIRVIAGSSGTFNSTSLRFSYVAELGIGGFVLVVIAAGASGEANLICLALALAAFVFAARACRLGIEYSSEGVRAFGILRTRQWSWTDLAGFTILVTPVANGEFRRKVLQVVTSDGQFVVLRDQSATGGTQADPSWLDAAVAALNQQIADLRVDTAASPAADLVSPTPR
jgi:hypothetical protein